MEIKQRNLGEGGEFYYEIDGEKIGEMTYDIDEENRMVINHTEVFDTERGKGVAKEMVRSGVEFARKNSQKIIPLCPYAKLQIDRTPEYQNVLFK